MLLRRHLGEFLGTALLVMAVVGSGIMATELTDDVGLQLLANAVATGGALFALITVFGPVSGASFNPVVSVIGRILDGGPGLRVVATDIVAQFAGAVVGCWAANAMFSRPWLETSSKVRDGGPQWFAEAVAVIGLVLVIRGGIRAKANVAAMVAGWITGAYWFTSSTSIANPAVAFGRMFSDSFAGISPGSTPMFVVMQVAGGAVALGLVLVLFGRGD
ncbi:MAG: aquaporin [Ilumatobacteraceae bacterium]|jgi:glycerol uptake facilitator-like aquaporin